MDEQELLLEDLSASLINLQPPIQEEPHEELDQISAFETAQSTQSQDGEGPAKQLSDGKPPRGGSKHSPPVPTRSSLARFASFGGADETLLQRVKHKTDELRALFDLPEGEVRFLWWRLHVWYSIQGFFFHRHAQIHIHAHTPTHNPCTESC